MNDTLPTDPAERELTSAMRRIADALDTLPRGRRMPYVQLTIVPDATEQVDALGMALFGHPGRAELYAGSWHHAAAGILGGSIRLDVTVTIEPPPDPRDAEIERLKDELAKAQAYLGTEGAVAQPKPDTYVAEFTGRASVPDMQTRPTLCSAEVEPGLVCGLPIYWDKGANAWWHQNREDRFKHTATGPSVPPQNGGE